jgi:MFS family permease
MPYFYWNVVFTIYTALWQSVYGISAIMTAVHILHVGILAFVVSFSGRLARIIHPKWLILGGQLAVLVSAIMFVFADSWDKYWRLVFPAFCIGTSGAMMAFNNNKFVPQSGMTFLSCNYKSLVTLLYSAPRRPSFPALAEPSSMVHSNLALLLVWPPQHRSRARSRLVHRKAQKDLKVVGLHGYSSSQWS